jgi:acetyl-CoA carboxylase biotin carboxyl carrier protein
MKMDEIRSLAQIMQDADLTSLEVNEGDVKIRLEKKHPAPPMPAILPVGVGTAAPCAPADTAGQKQENQERYQEIKSPMVGVFYAASSPESEPYVKVGSTVKKGDVICIIEAMKLLNEINADQDGEVAEICAENGQVVEYGQTLFRLR